VRGLNVWMWGAGLVGVRGLNVWMWGAGLVGVIALRSGSAYPVDEVIDPFR
jgi:hypothetical protein